MMLIYRLFIFILCIIPYLNSLQCGFVFDDLSALVQNPDLRSETNLSDLFVHDFWGTPLDREDSHKSYRPLTILTYRLQFSLHRLHPSYFHCVNVFLHCVVVQVFYVLVKKIARKFELEQVGISSEDVAFYASLLFAVHPIHTEAVTGIVGRAELLAALFFSVGLLIHVSFNISRIFPTVTVFFAFLATFSKEQGITLLATCCVWDLVVNHRNELKSNLFLDILRKFKDPVFRFRCFISIAGAIAILFIRLRMLKGALPVFAKGDNPASNEEFPTRHLTFAYIWSLNAWLLLCPQALCADWSMDTIDLVHDFLDWRNIGSASLIFFYLFAALDCLRSRSNRSQSGFTRLIFFSLFALQLCSFVPASNILFPVGFVIAERVLYLPSFGFCLLIALGYQKLLLITKAHRRVSLSVKLAYCFLLFAFSCKCILRNRDWIDDYSLFTSALRISTKNSKSLNNIGHALEKRGELSSALRYFTHASLVQPDDIGSWINIGRIESAMGQFSNAEIALKRAMELLPKEGRVAPGHLNVFVNLGNLYKNLSRIEEAERIYRRAINMRKDFVSAYMNLGDLLMATGRAEEALAVFQAGLRYEKTNPDLWYNTGVAMMKINRSDEALSHFDQALLFNGNHYYALVNSALLLMEKLGSDKTRILGLLEKAVSLQPNDTGNTQLLINIGNIYYENKLLGKARINFEQALALDSASRIAVLNLAVVQSDMGELKAAVLTLEKGLKIHSNFVKGWLTLCGFYADGSKNGGNFKLTRSCYEKVLALEPINIPARHNLCITLINLMLKDEASWCINEAAKLVAGSGHGYTMEHVRILKERFKKTFSS